MAKIRGIKPETWTDERFVSVSPLARLLFIGMWNFACDNGHLDDSAMQLKMRVLPVDSCDVAELLTDLIGCGLVERRGGFLKVPNLTEHQKQDRRFLVFCEHCSTDAQATYSPSDKAPRTSSARRVHDERADTSRERTSSARGDGDGDGETTPKGVVARTKHGTRIAEPFEVTTEMVAWAREHCPLIDGPRSTERFVNHFTAKTGRDATKLDWPATWRNWLLKDQSDAERGQPRKSKDEQVIDVLEMGRRMQAAEDGKAISA